MRRLISLLVLASLLLSGCTEEKKMEKQRNITINYNEPYEELIKRYPFIKKSTQASLSWYRTEWSPYKAATLKLNINNQPLLINEMIYLDILRNNKYADEGVSIIRLQSGITAEDWIGYDEARLKFHTILQNLLNKGWKRALSYYAPRFIGNDAMKYKLEQEEYHMLDPTYLPTLEQWKAMPARGTNKWKLHYKDQVYMDIKLEFTPHKTDADKAAYLLFIKVYNAEGEVLRHVDLDDKGRWQENWLKEIKKQALSRQKAEIEGVKKGYDIDVNYLDYQIPPGAIKTQSQLDAEVKSLTFKSGEVVPRSGYYEATLPDYNSRYGTLKANPRRYIHYDKGEVFKPFGFSEPTGSKIRWVFIVDSLPETVDKTP